jgi:hypothetical protein
MDYQEKYLKYKNKYITLKNQMFGGVKNDNDSDSENEYEDDDVGRYQREARRRYKEEERMRLRELQRKTVIPQIAETPETVQVPDNDQKYKEDLVMRITCPICLTNEVNTMFNCGHSLCASCAVKFPVNTPCPKCRKPIQTHIKMFLNKYLKY